jgi:CheY-like chemotaxis protein
VPAIAAAIAASVSDVNELLNSLLEISKLDAGTLVADKRPIHLSLMLESLAKSNFRARAESRGLRFELDVAPGQIAVTDLTMLKRVLSNLVDNAIKFTPQGQVRLALACLPDHFELSVSDTGVGIPAELQAMVFDEFYQVNRHAEGHAQGLGLGLSIVSRLSDLLGMTVVLESTPNVGTTVTLRIPRSEADTPPIATVSQAAPVIDLTDLRVLVLDDQETNCQAEAGLLQGWGCEVATALTIERARAAAQLFQPDVVLADYRLGNEENGIEAIALLREDHPTLLALLLSGDTGPERLREAHKSGLQLLSKPVNPDELKQALWELVAKD